MLHGGGNSTCSITVSYRIVCYLPDFNAELNAHVQCDPEATPFLMSTAHVPMPLCMRYSRARRNMLQIVIHLSLLYLVAIASCKIMLKRHGSVFI